jgi:DNA-binding transcriptional MerR regulator
MERTDAELLKIGQLARLTGLPVKRIHYYERRGLLEPSARSETGYRLYGAEEVARLEFIKRAKLLGLTLEEIRELVGLAARCNEGEIVPRLEEVLEAPSGAAEEALGWLVGHMRAAIRETVGPDLATEDCVEGKVSTSWGRG